MYIGYAQMPGLYKGSDVFGPEATDKRLQLEEDSQHRDVQSASYEG